MQQYRHEGRIRPFACKQRLTAIAAILQCSKDPGPPKREGKSRYEASTGSTYRTKEETEGKKDVFVNVVVALLVISFVAPMVQFFAYTKR